MPPTQGGAKREKSVSAVTHSQPLSIARAAWTASATIFPRNLRSSRSWRKMLQWRGPGRIRVQLRKARSRLRNWKACAGLEGGSRNPQVGRNPYETMQDQFREFEWLGSVSHLDQPRILSLVIRR